MKDRIQINGEWYIKESSNPLPEPEPLDIVTGKQIGRAHV